MPRNLSSWRWKNPQFRLFRWAECNSKQLDFSAFGHPTLIKWCMDEAGSTCGVKFWNRKSKPLFLRNVWFLLRIQRNPTLEMWRLNRHGEQHTPSAEGCSGLWPERCSYEPVISCGRKPETSLIGFHDNKFWTHQKYGDKQKLISSQSTSSRLSGRVSCVMETGNSDRKSKISLTCFENSGVFFFSFTKSPRSSPMN